MNNVSIIGRFTIKPELKQTTKGESVTTFSIAVRKNKEDAYFFNVVAWRNTAEFITKYFNKGDMTGIEGSLVQRFYEDKAGNKRTAIEILAKNVTFCGTKKQEESKENGHFEGFEELTTDEDLPF